MTVVFEVVVSVPFEGRMEAYLFANRQDAEAHAEVKRAAYDDEFYDVAVYAREVL